MKGICSQRFYIFYKKSVFNVNVIHNTNAKMTCESFLQQKYLIRDSFEVETPSLCGIKNVYGIRNLRRQ